MFPVEIIMGWIGMGRKLPNLSQKYFGPKNLAWLDPNFKEPSRKLCPLGFGPTRGLFGS